ncbi:hypothetical protein HD553DRAFT_322937 [Filobasidium floriforme]|uniref:uncharacterized protein n=1 Tax=Filobasidium floriforme TaxID=5210 RepID=UPI001E8CA882|nr:uncharacterized protein HD553DRAFT_322937 [Filobasidium floriforme]KAH8087461.1 hypothetical protein HD553DRAFT_322937 [Filobasidium floriforme]
MSDLNSHLLNMNSFDTLTKELTTEGSTGAAFTYMAPKEREPYSTYLSIPPTVLEKLPGQTPGRAKVPTILLYDKRHVQLGDEVLGLALTWLSGYSGVCQDKWGSQLTNLSKEERTKISKGELQLAEWFKIHIDPEQRRDVRAIAEEPSKRLPEGKQGVELWGEFLGRLSSAAKQAIRNDYNITWLEELEQSHKVRYIVSIPVGWLKSCKDWFDQQKHGYQPSILFGERGPDDVFLVVDAGGGTVDYTSYRITKIDPLCMEEVGSDSKLCLYNGSTYIDKSFRALLKEHLISEYTKSPTVPDKHLDKAGMLFATLGKLEFSFTTKDAPPGCYAISDNEVDYDEGEVSVPWTLMKSAFDQHVDLIYVFCSGGLGDSLYLRERLEMESKSFKVAQPDQTASSSLDRAAGAEAFHRTTIIQEVDYPVKGLGEDCSLTIFSTTAKTPPKRTTDPSAREVGKFEFFIPADASHTVEKAPDGTRLAMYPFEVRVYYGETELRAAAYSLDGEVLGGNRETNIMQMGN